MNWYNESDKNRNKKIVCVGEFQGRKIEFAWYNCIYMFEWIYILDII